MFKKLVQKLGVFNPEISAHELLDILQSNMPAWRWKIIQEKGDAFAIEGTKRWHLLTVSRGKDGHIYAFHAGRLRWEIVTLGVGWLIAELRKHTHQGKVRAVLREHVAIGEQNGKR